MFISKLLYLFVCELKFSLQIVIQLLYLVYVDYSSEGTYRQALTELKLLTVVSEE